MRSLRFVGSIGLMAASLATGATTLCFGQEEAIQFNRDIRPILSDHCFACHGPDANRREADLRLDTETGLLGSDGQPGPVVRGKLSESLLWERITTEDAQLRMPPDSTGKPLSEAQRTLLRRWIEQGAAYEGHWAFQPIDRPSVPKVEPPDRNNAIDHFLAEPIAKLSLELSPPADRRTLIRRLSLDLLGLPPSPQRVEQFASDTSSDAYPRLVEELLNSEHYGERMAMLWMDLVRYADSVGYHGDQEMSVSPYRDYLIDAVNRNVPFDQVTIEQLAGDLLPQTPGTSESRRLQIASGYNRLGMMSAEGGVQDKEYLAKYIAERVRNLGGTWMGLTLGCCECHDHKYDPFSIRNFYQLEAFFADIEEKGLYAGANDTGLWGPSIPVPTPEQEAKQQQLKQQLEEAEAEYRSAGAQSLPGLDQWLAELPSWTIVPPDQSSSAQGATLTLQPDHSLLASGNSPATDQTTLQWNRFPNEIQTLRIETLPDDSLPRKGPGRAGNGNFVLSELIVHWVPEGDGEPKKIPIVQGLASYEQTGAAGGNPYGKWAVAGAFDDDAKGPTWGWAVMERAGQRNDAWFALDRTAIPDQPGSLRVTLLQNLDNPQHTLGRFRVSWSAQPIPKFYLDQAPQETLAAADAAAQSRTEDAAGKLTAWWKEKSPTLQPMRDLIAARKKELEAHEKSIPVTLVTRTVSPRMVRVLARGNWMDDSGEAVEPSVPEVLSVRLEKSTPSRANRLDLARWLVAPEHPLTSRVLVNRLWKHFFGAGIARRVDDFGSQGDPPSHPELLDYLAARMIDSGWNIKEMIRLIVLSSAYQRSASATDGQMAADPTNRWLTHQNRYRMDAELVRDNALAVSDLLVRLVGGRSVRPYQPPGYWAYLNFPTREWQNSQGESLYRRGLYTHWQRQYLHPSLLAFDAPSREECTADRPRSNTPLQSLVLLNDPSYVEAARHLAEQLLADRQPIDDQRRLEIGFHRVVGRWPAEAETKVLMELLVKHRSQWIGDPEGAAKLVAVGASRTPLPQDQFPELAAWTSVCRVLLNLHETITRP
ncbi:MAG: PSD1 and planctomycete cytochrome C domain-containing protein [Pirellulaceae bacterium]